MTGFFSLNKDYTRECYCEENRGILYKDKILEDAYIWKFKS